MNKIAGWEKVQADRGDYMAVLPGSYYCEIVNAEITASRNGNEMLVLDLDIADGQFKGYYKNKFANDTRAKDGDRRYWGCKYYQLTEGEHVGRFKGLIENILDCNEGYKWTWDEKTLKGKTIGGLFRLEDFKAQDGSIKSAVKCYKLVSAGSINLDYIPQPKKMNGGFGKPVANDEDIPF